MNGYDLDLNNLPKHIAIIMDGNGRWAKKKGLNRTFGHKAGSDVVDIIVEACSDLGIKSLTLFAFSTENWKRPNEEVSALMSLIKIYIDKKIKRLAQNNVKLKVFGDIKGLPTSVQASIESAVKLTKNSTGMTLNIALNYGARFEIVNAVREIAKKCVDGVISIDDIDENIFSNYLCSSGQSDVDLLIRPSGEYRISNFMLYQCAYAEFWFSNILWPDFTKENLYEAIKDYQNRNRRFGGL